MTGVGLASGGLVILKTAAFHGVEVFVTTMALDSIFARIDAAVTFAAES